MFYEDNEKLLSRGTLLIAEEESTLMQEEGEEESPDNELSLREGSSDDECSDRYPCRREKELSISKAK